MKRLISTRLLLLLLLVGISPARATEQTHTHCICGGNEAAGHADCQETAWTALSGQAQAVEAGILSDSGRWQVSGQYYLADSVALESIVVIPDGVQVAICLNGNTLSGVGGTKRMFSVFGELSVCDCSPKTQWGAMETSAQTALGKEVYGSIAYIMNTTTVDGQTIPVQGEVNLYGGRFVNTGVASAGGLFFLGSTTLEGSSATLNLYDGILTGGVAQRPEGSKTAGEGGTVTLSNRSVFNMYGGRLEQGSCSLYGGHVAVFTGSTFRMTGGLIESGEAALYGGAIYSNNGTLLLEGGSITDSAAVGKVNASTGAVTDGKGGLIFMNGGKLTLSGTSLRRGSAVSDGGNVYVSGAGIVEMTGGTVTDGVSGREGGNFLVGTSATLTVSGDVAITGGTGTGGGNVMAFGTVRMKGCTLSGGTADNRGGNLYLFNKGNAYLEGVTLADGTANTGGNLFVGCNTDTVGSTAEAVLVDCTVTDGLSYNTGGNLYAYNSGRLTLERTVVRDGIAFNNAGNLIGYISDSYKDPSLGSLTIIDSLVVDGIATGTGDNAYARMEITLKGVVRITTESDARNVGLYMPAGYRVDGSGLKGGSLVDVTYSDQTQPFSLTGGGAEYFRGYVRRLKVVEQDGQLYLKLPKVAVYEGDTELAQYSFLEYAQNYHTGENQYIKLLADREEDVILNADTYVDLNGFDLAGSVELAGHSFYGMDSTTNLYEGAKAGTMTAAVTDGGVAAAPAGDTRSEKERTGAIYRYLAIPTEGGWQFHRIYLGIDTVKLRTANAGISYRSVFAGSEAVREYLDEEKAFGLTLSVRGVPEELKDFSYFPAAGFEAGVGNSRITSLINILSDTAADNASRAEAVIYGRAFLQTDDGHLVLSQPVAMTFRQVVELVDSRYESLTPEEQGYLQALYRKYAGVMSGWDLENLGKQEA